MWFCWIVALQWRTEMFRIARCITIQGMAVIMPPHTPEEPSSHLVSLHSAMRYVYWPLVQKQGMQGQITHVHMYCCISRYMFLLNIYRLHVLIASYPSLLANSRKIAQ
jgi:hypothetical protein